MKKIISGAKKFQEEFREDYIKQFKKKGIAQKPKAMLITCADSRIVPKMMTQTDPGDLFIIRTVGNLIAPFGPAQQTLVGASEGAALEFAINTLKIKDIIMCGHSRCGAIKTIMDGDSMENNPHLDAWIQAQFIDASPSVPDISFEKEFDEYDQVSQVNVLKQIEHLKTYPVVYKNLNHGHLKLHGWWFDITTAKIYTYREKLKRFRVIDKR